MAKYLGRESSYRIYELTEEECKRHGREYPTIVCWHEDGEIGNMNLTENETETVEEMRKWCR